MKRAHTYETPDERDEHVLFVHPYTSLRMLDPFALACSDKAAEFTYPGLHIGAPCRMRDLRADLVGFEAMAGSFNAQMYEWQVERDVMIAIAQLTTWTP